MKATTKFTLLTVLAVFYAPGLLVGGHHPAATQKKDTRTISLNGFKFRVPKGYVVIPGKEIVDSVFLFSKKYNEGFFLSVPAATVDEVEVLNRNATVALKKFFPAASPDYAWKPLADRRKVSKFEVGASKAMGFNTRDLVIVQVHHFQVNGKDFFVGDLFKWTNGNEKEIFASGLGGESMQGCNDLVDIVYSVTGEKIDEANFPCELIGILP